MATKKKVEVDEELLKEFEFFSDYGTVKQFIKRYKPEYLQVRYGAENPYTPYTVTKIKFLPKWLPLATVRYFYFKPTEFGITLFVTLW